MAVMLKRFYPLLFSSVCGAIAFAADSPPVAMSKVDQSLRQLVLQLRQSVRQHDANRIHAALAPDFDVTRDFGGVYDPAATPVQNFSAIFEFDNTKLRPEYKDHGWQRLGQALTGNRFEVKRDGLWCLPHGAQDKWPVPHEQMCFRKYASGWKIQRYIHGGD